VPELREAAPLLSVDHRSVTRRAFLSAAAGTAVGLAVARTARGAELGTSGSGAAAPILGRGDAAAQELAVDSRAVPWARLAGSLTGTLVTPQDPRYAVASQLYNERFDGIRPAAVAYCAVPADVQRCVAFARHHRVPVAARSGGHSYGGYSTCRGLVVDVTRMAGVRVDARGTRATVGAGARLIDLYAALGAAGRLLPGGSCPTVGVAGLTLGGGISVFSRRYGLTCDQLRGLRIVTADGRLLACGPEHDEDLYWASRGGGGGNFGIATSFEFDVHPIPPVALFTLQWPFGAAADVLGAWMRWMAGAPDDLWSNCQLLSAGSAGGAFVRTSGVLCGSASALASLLRPLQRAVGTAPTTDFVGQESYLPAMLIEAGCAGKTVAACHLPSQNPSGTLSRAAFAAKSAYVVSMPPGAAVSAAVDAVSTLDRDVPAVGGGIVFDAYGGAINAVAPDATAFVHRDALACAQWSVFFGPDAAPPVVEAGSAWLAATARSLAPYVRGAYQNYIDPELKDWARAYYGANLERLVKVKRRVDPDDFFHFAQSVPTHLG